MEFATVAAPVNAPLVPAPHDVKVYDLTDTYTKICCCGTFSNILTLEPEEAVLIRKSCIFNENKRLPYGELGNVDKLQTFGCCHAFNSNLSPVGDGGQPMPISPGCGCSSELVDEVVAELKQRMKGRGDTGNILRAEDAIRLLLSLVNKSAHQEAKMDAVLEKMEITVPPQQAAVCPEHQRVIFQHQHFDVTDTCHMICCCGGKKLLNLEPEETNFTVTTCCSTSTSRRPYGELGNVSVNSCCCFRAVGSGVGIMSPGCGCDGEAVTKLAEELKIRMKERGDTGNIQRQEEQIKMVQDLLNKVAQQDTKVNAILGEMNIALPPSPPPAQQAM